MKAKEIKTKESKMLNPVYEYFQKLKGTLIINDPMLLA